MPEINDYLKDGPLTERSPLIETKVKDIIKIPGDNIATSIQIIEWIRTNFKKAGTYEGEYNAQKLFELMILSDHLGYSVVFSVAARMKEIPVRCVEAVTADTLNLFDQKQDTPPLKYAPRHYFIEIYDRKEWVVVGLPNCAFISGPERHLLHGKLHYPTGIGLDYLEINKQGSIEDRIKTVLSKQP